MLLPLASVQLCFSLTVVTAPHGLQGTLLCALTLGPQDIQNFLLISLACFKTHHPFQSQEAQTDFLTSASQASLLPPLEPDLSTSGFWRESLFVPGKGHQQQTHSFPFPIPKCKGHLCSRTTCKYNTSTKDSNCRDYRIQKPKFYF